MRLSVFKCCLLWATLLVPALSSLPSNYNVTAPPGLDPITNFCTRVDHQSVIKNGILYIDGGSEVFNFNSTNGQGTQVQGYNTFLIAVNMTTSWDWKLNISEILINKTAVAKTGTYPPLVLRAGLYHGPPNDPNIYLYGGTTSSANQSFPGWMAAYPAQYTLWGFDTSSANTGWSQYDVSITVPQRPNAGSYTEAPDLGLGFYYNGELDRGSSQGMDLILGQSRRFLEGMVVLYFNNHTAQNFSTENVQYHDPRTRGQLQYVPGYGHKGILVSMAGSYKPSIELDTDEIANLVDMSSIDIFDVNSLYDGSGGTTWYTQKATGDIPSPRVDTCLVYATAPDNSSTNFYLYGGRNATGFYDDVYVLSLPSFTWIKIYEGLSPRYGMTCHFVGNRQMLTVGGLSAQPEACDWEVKSVAIYDLSSLTWGSVYTADDDPYTVPDIVFTAIGGNAEGKATVTTPSGGYSSLGLAHLFNSDFAVNATSNSTSSTPTSSPVTTSTSAAPPPSESPTQSHTGAIVGGVVGGIGGLALIAGILFFFFRLRKRPSQVSELSTDQLTRLEKDRSQAVEKDGRVARPDIDGELDQAMRASREPHVPPAELMSPETYVELNSPHSFAELGSQRPYIETTSTSYVYPEDNKNAI